MTRARVLKRDDYACQLDVGGRKCLAPANQADHVIPAYQGGSDDESNLRALCSPHHRALSSSQGGQASASLRRSIAAKRKRPRERHPGLLEAP